MPSFAEREFFMAFDIVQFTLQTESSYRIDKNFKILAIVEKNMVLKEVPCCKMFPNPIANIGFHRF